MRAPEAPASIRYPADYKSAIRQIGNLRYFVHSRVGVGLRHPFHMNLKNSAPGNFLIRAQPRGYRGMEFFPLQKPLDSNARPSVRPGCCRCGFLSLKGAPEGRSNLTNVREWTRDGPSRLPSGTSVPAPLRPGVGRPAHLREYRPSSREPADAALLRNALTCALPQADRARRLAYGARTRALVVFGRSRQPLICWRVWIKMRLPAGGSPNLAT